MRFYIALELVCCSRFHCDELCHVDRLELRAYLKHQTETATAAMPGVRINTDLQLWASLNLPAKHSLRITRKIIFKASIKNLAQISSIRERRRKVVPNCHCAVEVFTGKQSRQ